MSDPRPRGKPADINVDGGPRRWLHDVPPSPAQHPTGQVDRPTAEGGVWGSYCGYLDELEAANTALRDAARAHPAGQMTGEEFLDHVYERAAKMYREGKRVRLVVEPDERLVAAEAKLAEVQALAERWYWSDDSTYLDYCGRKVLEALDVPMPTERGTE